MAIVHTELDGRETEGEKLVYRRLKSLLPDEYVMWHNKYLPGDHSEADFIILHPSDGLWVIEVKDWLRKQIVTIDDRTCRLRKGILKTTTKNPVRQALENAHRIKGLLERVPVLRQAGGPHDGKLVLPVNHLAVFTGIDSKDLQDLSAALPEQFVLTRDFLDHQLLERDELVRRLRSARRVAFSCNLNDSQVEEIKLALGTARVPGTDAPAALDDHQDKLAAEDLTGQIVIEGPAGSGKSVVLLLRALRFVEGSPGRRALVVCFNTVMANYLRRLAATDQRHTGRDQLHINDVHEWIAVHCPGIRAPHGRDHEARIAAAAEVVQKDESLKYDGVFVDEGQDASDSQLRLYRALLKAPSGALTFCLDEKQQLYTGSSIVERLDSFGFQIDKERKVVRQKRSVLVMLALAFYQQRQPAPPEPAQIWAEVENLAQRLFIGFKHRIQALVSGTLRLIPGLATRGSLEKQIADAVTFAPAPELGTIASLVTAHLERLHRSGTQWGRMMVLFPTRRLRGRKGEGGIDLAAALLQGLERAQVPFLFVDRELGVTFNGTHRGPSGDNRRSADLDSDAVKVMTIHASKGLDADHVVLAGFEGIDDLQDGQKAPELGYVAITRARKTVHVICHRGSPSVKALRTTWETVKDAGA